MRLSISLPLLALLLVVALLPQYTLASIDTLWPLPSSYFFVDEGPTVYIDPFFRILMPSRVATPLLNSAFARYATYMFAMGVPPTARKPTLTTLNVQCYQPLNETLGLNSDESYTLNVTSEFAILIANEVWGILRGLETFYQLIDYDAETKSYSISHLPISIADTPRFPWRGLLLDTARHYLPVNSILRTIDAMAFNKMNTLHWHITDSQSFPLFIPEVPGLSEAGAWDASAIYTPADVDNIVRYARMRGVRVVPEIDVPSHVKSWGWAYPGITLNDCQGVKDMIPFDPTQEQLYPILEKVFSYLSSKFPELYIHLGGDEVKYQCWSTGTIVAWMRQRNMSTPNELQQYFTDRLGSYLVNQLGRKDFVVWYEFFSQQINLPGIQDMIIQAWMDATHIRNAINAGYRTITSVGWYLDRQVPDQPPNYQWVDTWVTFWKNEPTKSLTSPDTRHHLLGGEAAMWAEHVDAINLDSRVWPRAAGVAERLWSPQLPRGAENILLEDARIRMAAHRCRLARRGVGAGPTMPDYCLLPAGLFSCNATKEIQISNCTRQTPCPECPSCSPNQTSPQTPPPTTPKPTTPRPTTNATCKDECALCTPTDEQCSDVGSATTEKPLFPVTGAFLVTFIAGLLTGIVATVIIQLLTGRADHQPSANGTARPASRQYARI